MVSSTLATSPVVRFAEPIAAVISSPRRGQVQLRVKRAAARVEHPHAESGVAGSLETLRGRRAEHGGRDEPPAPDAAELPLDQADAPPLHKRDPEERLLSVLKHTTNGVERLTERFDVYVYGGHGSSSAVAEDLGLMPGQQLRPRAL